MRHGPDRPGMPVSGTCSWPADHRDTYSRPAVHRPGPRAGGGWPLAITGGNRAMSIDALPDNPRYCFAPGRGHRTRRAADPHLHRRHGRRHRHVAGGADLRCRHDRRGQAQQAARLDAGELDRLRRRMPARRGRSGLKAGVGAPSNRNRPRFPHRHCRCSPSAGASPSGHAAP